MKGRHSEPTFRDPAGSLRLEDDRAVRTIHPPARNEVLNFLGCGLCARLEADGRMVRSDIEESGTGLALVHPRIAVASYPWEWTRSQWVAAADLTLDLCEEGLRDGWILKDATPLNVLFEGARPVLVDVLSFERARPGNALWLAYGQYVRTFLLPLLMHKLLHWPLALSLFRRDGLEPVELYAALSWTQRLGRDALWPVTLPAWMDRRGEQPERVPGAGRVTSPEAALHALQTTLKGLRKRTLRAGESRGESQWSEYAGNLTHYSAEDNEAKREWVVQIAETLRPGRVLDVGANTGDYSMLLAEKGAQVVALERDVEAADRLFLRSRDAGLSILTMCADLARPTPAVGWQNAEYSSLLARLEGQFDLVLMLAVIHHLLLMEQIPLRAIVQLCAQMTRRWLVVEWVPVADPMFQSLMRGRDSLYGNLCEDDLLAACAGCFAVRERHALGNGRVLLLLEKETGC